MAESETLKRKATVAVNATPAGGGMEEGPFVCHLPSRPDGMPPEGTEWMAWRKNVEFRGHHLVLRGRTRGVDYVGNNFASAGTPAANACSYFVARLRRVASGKKAAAAAADADASDPEYELDVTPVGGGGIVDLQTRCHAQEYDAPVWDGAEDMNDPGVRAKYNDRLLRAFSSAKRQRKVARIQAERRVDASSLAAPDAMRANLVAATAGELDARALAELAGARGTSRRTTRTPPTRTTRTRCGVSRCTPSPIARGGKTCWRRRRSRRSSSLCARTATWTASCWTWCPDWIRLDPTRRRREKPPKRWRSWTRSWRSGRTRAPCRSGGGRNETPTTATVARDASRDADDAEKQSFVDDDFVSLSWTHDTKVDLVTQRAFIDAFMEQSRSDTPGEPRRFVRPKASSDLVTLHCIR